MTDPFTSRLGAGRRSNADRETAHQLRHARGEIERLRERLRGVQQATELLLRGFESKAGNLARMMPHGVPGSGAGIEPLARASSLHHAITTALRAEWLVPESEPDPCPSCGRELRGSPIPAEQQPLFGATHFTRRQAGWEDEDDLSGWGCPDCGYTLPD